MLDVRVNQLTAAALDPDSSREKLVCPAEFRVLALDGGGVRGALIAGFLREVEAQLKKNNPEDSIASRVDLIVGTSTGAIVGALLAKGDSAESAYQFYRELGHSVFPSPWTQVLKWACFSAVVSIIAISLVWLKFGLDSIALGFFECTPLWLRYVLWFCTRGRISGMPTDVFPQPGPSGTDSVATVIAAFILVMLLHFVLQLWKNLPLYWALYSKYGVRSIDAALQRAFGQLPMDKVARRLIVNTYNLATDEAITLKTTHIGSETETSTKGTLLAEAVRSSTAAPSFFPPKDIGNGRMLNADGGLFANNPSMVGYVEAAQILRCLRARGVDVEGTRIRVLSIGTGQFRASRFKKPTFGFGILWWAKPALRILLTGQPRSAHHMIMRLIPAAQDYVRVNFAIPARLESMDNPANLDDLLSAGTGSALLEAGPAGVCPTAAAFGWLTGTAPAT